MGRKAQFNAADIEPIQCATGRKFELVRGELIDTTRTLQHAASAAQIAGLLVSWNRVARAGNVAGNAGFWFEKAPDTVLSPDVCFIRKGRITAEMARNGYPEMAPDFVALIRGDGDSWSQLRNKAEMFLDRGTALAVMLEVDEFVQVLAPSRGPRRLGLQDVFEAPGVLPGFSCRVGDFFPEVLP